ncbi:MAG: outer membrane biogenesis protein BamB [Verrucomicrobia bacterium ADurb.Bin006]|nr:MAG: outer membrane biogenesis protein BamB [Verrucomicrobia bacterium ADurb.Bin006]
MLWGATGQPDWDITDGQLDVSTLEGCARFDYARLYDLPEGQPVEFRVDLVSADTNDSCVILAVGFTGPLLPKPSERGYALSVSNNRVGLAKIWDGIESCFFERSVSHGSDPRTVSLSVTREGAALEITVQVALRDEPQTVMVREHLTDQVGPDAMVQGSDPGPPPSGPVTTVSLGFGVPPGTATRSHLTVDNLACSEDQAPALLRIQADGANGANLAWPGWHIPLESDSVLGPWRPRPARVSLGEGEYRSAVPPADAGRFYRLARGVHVFDSFDGGTTWDMASVLPDGLWHPTWTVLADRSCGRILGAGTQNQDFVLRSGSGIEYGDCVAVVDIIGWGEAMEGAAFGIVLRANSGQDTWQSDTPGLPEERYAGLLTFMQADPPFESALSITGPGGAVLGEQNFPALHPNQQYRLRFWAVGDQLTLELFDRENLDRPIQTCLVTDGRIGEGMACLYGTRSASGTFDVTVDEFMLNGVTVVSDLPWDFGVAWSAERSLWAHQMIIQDGVVYSNWAGASAGTEGELTAIDLKTGTVLRSIQGVSFQTAPLLVDGRLFSFWAGPVAAYNSVMYELDAETFTILQSHDVTGTVYQENIGYDASLRHAFLRRNIVGKSAISAFNIDTWEAVWTTDPNAPDYFLGDGYFNGTSVLSIQDGRAYAHGRDSDGENFIIALDAKTGERVWKSASIGFTGGAPGDYAYNNPIYGRDADLIFASTCWASISALRPANGEILWSRNLRGSGYKVTSTLTFDHDNRVFVGLHHPSGGAYTCLDAGTGEVLWTSEGYSEVDPQTGLTVYDDGWSAGWVDDVFFYQNTHAGPGAIVVRNKRTGDIVWTYDTENQPCTNPVAAAGLVLFGNGRYLVAVRAGYGEATSCPWHGQDHSGCLPGAVTHYR